MKTMLNDLIMFVFILSASSMAAVGAQTQEYGQAIQGLQQWSEQNQQLQNQDRLEEQREQAQEYREQQREQAQAQAQQNQVNPYQ